MNELRIAKKRIKSGDVEYAAILSDDLAAVALDYVPRIFVDKADVELAAIVNVEYLRQLIEAKEEYDWLLQQPINQRCIKEVKLVQARREVVDGELTEYSRRLMNDTCPSCRRNLIAKYGTPDEQDADLWRRVKNIGDWSKPKGMFDRVSRRSGVGVAALGRGNDPQGAGE